MKENHFFAMMSRMKVIDRWGLMRNTIKENDSEHSLDVAMIAHALGVINNVYFDGNIDANRLALMGMYHDAIEIITGDIPTPIKYHSDEVRTAFREVERVAKNSLVEGLPPELRQIYAPLLVETEEEKELWRYVKAADKLSAYIKCIEEQRMGNVDFAIALDSIKNIIDNLNMPEVDLFMNKFIPAYSLTLDELK